jgi:hypothetical protein
MRKENRVRVEKLEAAREMPAVRGFFAALRMTPQQKRESLR